MRVKDIYLFTALADDNVDFEAIAAPSYKAARNQVRLPGARYSGSIALADLVDIEWLDVFTAAAAVEYVRAEYGHLLNEKENFALGSAIRKIKTAPWT